MILELFNILRIKPANRTISEESNMVLEQMGVGEEQARKFAYEMNQYLISPSFVSLLRLYQNLGLIRNGGVEKYQIAFQQIQRNWFRKNMILFFLHVGKVNREITTFVKLNLPMEIVHEK